MGRKRIANRGKDSIDAPCAQSSLQEHSIDSPLERSNAMLSTLVNENERLTNLASDLRRQLAEIQDRIEEEREGVVHSSEVRVKRLMESHRVARRDIAMDCERQLARLTSEGRVAVERVRRALELELKVVECEARELIQGLRAEYAKERESEKEALVSTVQGFPAVASETEELVRGELTRARLAWQEKQAVELQRLAESDTIAERRKLEEASQATLADMEVKMREESKSVNQQDAERLARMRETNRIAEREVEGRVRTLEHEISARSARRAGLQDVLASCSCDALRSELQRRTAEAGTMRGRLAVIEREAKELGGKLEARTGELELLSERRGQMLSSLDATRRQADRERDSGESALMDLRLANTAALELLNERVRQAIAAKDEIIGQLG